MQRGPARRHVLHSRRRSQQHSGQLCGPYAHGREAEILEDEVTVGHSVTLHGCYIEHGALIGIGSIVLDDARIGAQSLIAAGSLISPGTVIPPRSLVMGAPGRVKRPLTDEEVEGLNAFWMNYVNYVGKYKAVSSRQEQ